MLDICPLCFNVSECGIDFYRRMHPVPNVVDYRQEVGIEDSFPCSGTRVAFHNGGKAGPGSRSRFPQAVRVANVPVPAFQNGYVFSLDGASVQLFAPEGYPAFVRVLQIPGAAHLTARGLAVDSDGSVAVSVEYQTSTGFGAGIAFLDRHGIDTGFLNTDQYEPANLSYGEDHSLWTFGWQRDGSTHGFLG